MLLKNIKQQKNNIAINLVIYQINLQGDDFLDTNSSKTFRQHIGNLGEDAAVRYLQKQGYRILARNYAVHNVGELDIIAEKESDIYVLEVRTRLNRGSYPNSEESVTASKRKKITKTAERYIAENNLYDRNVVFEVIKVTHDSQGNIISVEFVPF